MLRDTRVGLIEPMLAARVLVRSRSDRKRNEHRTIDPHALKIPALKERNLRLRRTLTV